MPAGKQAQLTSLPSKVLKIKQTAESAGRLPSHHGLSPGWGLRRPPPVLSLVRVALFTLRPERPKSPRALPPIRLRQAWPPPHAPPSPALPTEGRSVLAAATLPETSPPHALRLPDPSPVKAAFTQGPGPAGAQHARPCRPTAPSVPRENHHLAEAGTRALNVLVPHTPAPFLLPSCLAFSSKAAALPSALSPLHGAAPGRPAVRNRPWRGRRAQPVTTDSGTISWRDQITLVGLQAVPGPERPTAATSD